MEEALCDTRSPCSTRSVAGFLPATRTCQRPRLRWSRVSLLSLRGSTENQQSSVMALVTPLTMTPKVRGTASEAEMSRIQTQQHWIESIGRGSTFQLGKEIGNSSREMEIM